MSSCSKACMHHRHNSQIMHSFTPHKLCSLSLIIKQSLKNTPHSVEADMHIYYNIEGCTNHWHHYGSSHSGMSGRCRSGKLDGWGILRSCKSHPAEVQTHLSIVGSFELARCSYQLCTIGVIDWRSSILHRYIIGLLGLPISRIMHFGMCLLKSADTNFHIRYKLP